MPRHTRDLTGEPNTAVSHVGNGCLGGPDTQAGTHHEMGRLKDTQPPNLCSSFEGDMAVMASAPRVRPQEPHIIL